MTEQTKHYTPRPLKPETRAKLEEMQTEALKLAEALGDVLNGTMNQSEASIKYNGNKLAINSISGYPSITKYFENRVKLSKDEKLEVLLAAEKPMQKLVRDLFGILNNRIITLTEDNEKAILELMDSQLTDNELTAVNMRYGLSDGKEYTLEQIGKVLVVNRERARQILNKALAKLRYKRRMVNIVFDGMPAQISTLEAEIATLSREQYTQKLAELRAKAEDIKSGQAPEIDLEVNAMLIDDLDLTVRSFNVLKRHGLNTVADVVLYLKDHNILKMKSMGRKSAHEIADKLASYGIHIEIEAPSNNLD